jgi:hypothetical protein
VIALKRFPEFAMYYAAGDSSGLNRTISVGSQIYRQFVRRSTLAVGKDGVYFSEEHSLVFDQWMIHVMDLSSTTVFEVLPKPKSYEQLVKNIYVVSWSQFQYLSKFG